MQPDTFSQPHFHLKNVLLQQIQQITVMSMCFVFVVWLQGSRHSLYLTTSVNPSVWPSIRTRTGKHTNRLHFCFCFLICGMRWSQIQDRLVLSGVIIRFSIWLQASSWAALIWTDPVIKPNGKNWDLTLTSSIFFPPPPPLQHFSLCLKFLKPPFACFFFPLLFFTAHYCLAEVKKTDIKDCV